MAGRKVEEEKSQKKYEGIIAVHAKRPACREPLRKCHMFLNYLRNNSTKDKYTI